VVQRGPDGHIYRKYENNYDRYGNRRKQELVEGSLGYSSQFSFNSDNNRVSGFTYDNSGNVTNADLGVTFSYDQENFLAAAGGSISYKVDAQGRRVRKTVGSTVTDYFYVGAEVIAEKTGSAWTDYIFFGGQRIAQNTGTSLSTTKFLHPDHLGSTRVCTDGSGNSAGTCHYEPFGEVRPGTTCSVPTAYRFAGMEWDGEIGGHGLYHTWYRQYDPSQGRWLGVDPLPGSEGDPQSLNRYAYVLNDPVILRDPLGLAVIVQIGNCIYELEAESVSSRFIHDSGEGSNEGSAGDGRPTLTITRITLIGCYGGFRGDRLPPRPAQLNPFAAAVLEDVWNRIGFLAQPTCPGSEGAYSYIGGALGGGSRSSFQAFVIPLSYDAKSGFSSGVYFQFGKRETLGPRNSPFSVGGGASYSWSSGAWGGAPTLVFHPKFAGNRGVRFGGGLSGDGSFSLFGGALAGGGVYFKPSFLGSGSCK
jgi:RHS repeat-associated protein